LNIGAPIGGKRGLPDRAFYWKGAGA